ILSVSQLREASDDRHEVVRIARFQFVQKFSYRALPCPGFIELYCKIHSHATSILMLTWSDLQSGSEHDQDGRRAGIRLLPKLLDHVAPSGRFGKSSGTESTSSGRVKPGEFSSRRSKCHWRML